MNDPKLSIKDLIRDNWNSDNTSGVTPSTHTGWYDLKSTMPQITVTDPSEVVEGGGASGYTGMGSDGTPSQLMKGGVDVNLWCTRLSAERWLALTGSSTIINPKKCIFEMRQEIARIVKAGYESITDLSHIVWRGGGEIVETDKSPVVYRFAGEIGYSYLN